LPLGNDPSGNDISLFVLAIDVTIPYTEKSLK